MISFQHIKSGRFLRSVTQSGVELVPLLADAYPWHTSDEKRLRRDCAFLVEFRTVTYSTRIDHPDNDLSRLTSEELAQRYPVTR